MTTAFFKKSILTVAIALASSQAHSAAFQLNEHSASGLGRAYAGEAAIADNASVLARNPAAMTRFDKMALSVAGTYIRPDVDVDGDVTYGGMPLAKASRSNIAPDAFVPAAYFIQPIKDDLVWGLAMFTNYGLSTEYPSSYNAGTVGGSTELTTFNINPNLAYRVAPGFSLGAGLNLVYAEAELNRYAGVLPALVGQQTPANTNVSHLKGDDWGFGWNAGMLYEFNQDHRVALTYRSKVDIKFKGDYKGTSSGMQKVDGTLNLELPAMAEFAAYHRIDPRFAVHYSVNWTDWSAFNELRATSNDCANGVCLLKEENFKDSWRYSIGGTWYVNPSWEARIGLAYDTTPIRSEYRSLSIPDSDRVWYSAGATYHIDQNMSIDFGMTYIDGKEVKVNEGMLTHEGEPRWQGSSHGDAFLASAQFNMMF